MDEIKTILALFTSNSSLLEYLILLALLTIRKIYKMDVTLRENFIQIDNCKFEIQSLDKKFNNLENILINHLKNGDKNRQSN